MWNEGGNPMSRNVRWAIWMTAFGLLTAAIVYVATESVLWSIVALFGAGVVGNAVANAGRAR
jgi:hypothetical protein